ncbi:MAG TPA: hypothetical protein VM818_09135 [Vicinamibacterales bacterium]|jgi:hypothetical protein|nr:hypothetical protein [Vicinamibacterales bacterium]
MRTTLRSAVAVLVLLMMPAAVAQQGHPLVGVWSGDWGPTAADRRPVLIEMTWENTTLGGTINPGEADAAPIKVGRLNSTNWTVHLEGEGKDEKGNALRVVVDGQIENLGSPKRTISGTWLRGTTKGTFKVTRE